MPDLSCDVSRTVEMLLSSRGRVTERFSPDFAGGLNKDRVPGDHTKGARFVVMLPAIDM
jgi:hypothetical protein